MHAALLAAGQVTNRRHQLCGLKAKPLHKLARSDFFTLHDVAGLIAAQHFLNLVLAQLLQLVQTLGKNGELHGLADVHVAHGRGKRAIDELEQRGLAGTISADDAETVARTDQPCHVIENLTAGHGDFACGGCRGFLVKGIAADGLATGVLAANLTLDVARRIGLRFTRLGRGLDGFGHTRINQSGIVHIGDGHLNGTMQLRLGIHGVHHVHT